MNGPSYRPNIRHRHSGRVSSGFSRIRTVISSRRW
jgi:hypothetical protein